MTMETVKSSTSKDASMGSSGEWKTRMMTMGLKLQTLGHQKGEILCCYQPQHCSLELNASHLTDAGLDADQISGADEE